MANVWRNDLYVKLLFIKTNLVLCIFALSIIPVTPAFAATVNLAWDASSGSNVAGYKMYYGTSSRNYSNNIKVGNSTSCSVPNLQEGKKYYFAATAYNSSNLESSYSSEVSYTVPTGSSSVSATTIILDNGGSGTSASGTWNSSGGSGSYGANSVYSKSVGATYTFQGSRSGDQDVYLWYTYYDSRYTNVPVKIYNGSTLVGTVFVDQQDEQNAGKWYYLGTHRFSGTAKVVIESKSSSASTCADAVKIETAGTTSSSSSSTSSTSSTSGSTTGNIIDNGGSGTSASGTWKSSGGSGSYGANSLYSKSVGATYTFQGSRSGDQDVYLWYTYYDSRYTNVPVKIYNGSTLVRTVFVDQQDEQNAGKWYYLGTYRFTGTAKVVIESKSSSASTCADAVKIEPAGSSSSSSSSSGSCTLNAKFQETTMEVGAEYYTDRDYTIRGGVPSWMDGLTLIKTVNNELSNKSSSGYVQFTNPVDGWVYVLFDSRSSSIPTWLKGWELISDRITTSLSTQPYLKVYQKQFDAGQCVDLGGNYGTGSSSETRSNYVVVYDN